jgi:hypothetical protein
MGTAPPLGEASHQTFPAPGHEPRWLNSKGLHAHLTSPEVAKQPPLDEQPDGLGRPPAQEQGHRPSSQKSHDASTTLLVPELGDHLSHNTRLGSTNRPGRPETPRGHVGLLGHREAHSLVSGASSCSTLLSNPCNSELILLKS